ncbi:MAG: DUF5050 domain-containing protein [Oscillospiraceae bacterium]|nr:DUF5050 domain-containing protein [Oscillospiraceae bacterium]
MKKTRQILCIALILAVFTGAFAVIQPVRAQEEDAPFVLGDASGNGKVDIEDARLVLQHLVGKIILNETQLAAADVDGNGVGITSARLILQYLVGKILAFPREANKVGNTPGNLMHGGLAAIQGDWIYYSNGRDEGRLYRMKADGSDKQKINNDHSLYINVVGDWIYYCNRSDGYGGSLYRIKIDGSSRQQVSYGGCSYINVVDDWIYYAYDNLYRRKIDGSNEQKLSDDNPFCWYINVVDDWIYYCNRNDEEMGTYRIKIDGSDKQKLNNDWLEYINVVGDWIYYNNPDDGIIYRMTTNGDDKQIVGNATLSSNINVVGDWIYYTEGFWYTGGSCPYRIKTDGSNRQKLSDDWVASINVVGDWIYCLAEVNWDECNLYRMKLDGSENQLVD